MQGPDRAGEEGKIAAEQAYDEKYNVQHAPYVVLFFKKTMGNCTCIEIESRELQTTAPAGESSTLKTIHSKLSSLMK